MDKKHFKVDSSAVGERLDTFISEKYDLLSRSQIKRMLDDGDILVFGVSKKVSYKVREGDEIELTIRAPKKIETKSQNIPIDIIYEDSDIVVVNKSANMVVHPAPGNPDGTLVNALLYHCKDLSGIGGALRPGIVHRLDKGTSGLIVVAKNDKAHLSLSEQFKERTTKKDYLALIFGSPKEKHGSIETEIGRHPTDRKKMSTNARSGRDSKTDWKLIESFDKHVSLVKIRLVTGRTHQIRVHFASIGWPLLGDDVYGGRKVIKRIPEGEWRDVVRGATRPMLHSYSIQFSHPVRNDEMKFKVDPPEDFQTTLEGLRELSS